MADNNLIKVLLLFWKELSGSIDPDKRKSMVVYNAK